MMEKNCKGAIRKLLAALIVALAVCVLGIYSTADVAAHAKESTGTSTLVKKTLEEINIKKKDSVYNKVKKVHDWLVFNITYDHLWLDVDDGKTSGYTKAQIADAKTHKPAEIEWVLKNKLAICQGYSVVFKAMMDELGIECKVISSKAMNHAWNMVKMDDGYWYHIDVTWDDSGYTGSTELGGYNTENFLRSDKGISEKHYEWSKDAPKANGKKYEKNVKHDYRYNITPKDEYWENGNIKINYNCNDYSLYTKYSKTGVVTYKKFRYSNGPLGENWYSKKGVLTKERTEFTNGDVSTTIYKKGVISSEKTVFSSGQIQEQSYNSKGVITAKKTTFADGGTYDGKYENGVLSHEKWIHVSGDVREAWYNKAGVKIKETYTFTSGAYWLEEYDDNGNLTKKSYFFEDGSEKIYQ